MIAPLDEHPRYVFIVLRGDGTILSEHGLGRSLQQAGVRDHEREGARQLTRLLRAEDGTSVEEAVARAARAGRSSPPPSIRVRPVGPSQAPLLRLVLYRLDDDRIVGILSTEDDGPSGAGTRLIHAWSALRDAMLLASLESGEEEPRIRSVNDAFCTLFGISPGEATGRRMVPFLAPSDESTLLRELRATVLDARRSLTALCVIEDASGTPRLVEWEVAPVRDDTGRVDRLIAVLGEARSSTMSRALQKSLDVDSLTGMPDRAHFAERVAHSLDRAGQVRSYAFAVIHLETEDLPVVEKRLGSAVANAVLEALAWRVGGCLRPGDLIARIGRQRLGVLLDGFSSHGSVEAVVERIHQVVEAPYSIAGETIRLPAVGSAGPIYSGVDLSKTASDVMDRLNRLSSRSGEEQRHVRHDA